MLHVSASVAMGGWTAAILAGGRCWSEMTCRLRSERHGISHGTGAAYSPTPCIPWRPPAVALCGLFTEARPPFVLPIPIHVSPSALGSWSVCVRFQRPTPSSFLVERVALHCTGGRVPPIVSSITMSRFSNFLLYSAISTLVYFALFLEIVPTPGVSDQVKGDILPVVSNSL